MGDFSSSTAAERRGACYAENKGATKATHSLPVPVGIREARSPPNPAGSASPPLGGSALALVVPRV